MAELAGYPPGTPAEAPPAQPGLRVPQAPQLKMVQPGAAERALEGQYRDEGVNLEGRLAPIKSDMSGLEGDMDAIASTTPKLSMKPPTTPAWMKLV